MPKLAVSRIEAAQSIREQIDAGVHILNYNINSEEDLDEAKSRFSKWWDYCRDLLNKLFIGDQLSKAFSSTSQSIVLLNPTLQAKVKEHKKLVSEHVTTLESIQGRLEFCEEPMTQNTVSSSDPLTVPFPRAESNEPVFAQPRFRRRPSGADARLGFVLMPFESSFADVLKESIRPAIEANGLNCKRADEVANNDEIMEDVWTGIWTSRLIVVDLTGDNPNVFYELGIADTVGKEVVLIAQRDRVIKPPFDVSHRRIIFYANDTGGRVTLRDELMKMIAAVLQKSGSS